MKPAPNLSKGAGDPPSGRSRVCIVTAELEGPFLNGGVGSTNRGLALALRQLGHEVDVLYTQVAEGQPLCLRGTFAGHVDAYARHGIRLLAIHNRAAASDWPVRSWLVLQHLLQDRPDLVFFDDIFGTGYYPLLARRTGAPELAGTAMVVTAHGALEWVGEQDEVALLNFDGLALFEMERRSLELADAVRAPSRHILRKYAGYGWHLPPDPVVMPNFVSAPKARRASTAPARLPVNEIVFFGRLETRKGIWLFLRAIDRIKHRLGGATVTFLGKSRETAGPILRHALGWPFEIRLFTDFNQDQAVAYLRGPGRLAVMPSPEDNSPSTVLECLDHRIAFLATSGSGAEELIDPACHAANLVAPTVDALAQGILQALETGGSVARHGHDPDRLLADFAAFVERMLDGRHLACAAPERQGQRQGPGAVLALAPHGQPPEVTAALLRQGIAGLDGATSVHVVTPAPDLLRPLLADPRLRLWSHADLGAAALALADEKPAVVALCDTGAIPDRGWFDRAALCLAGDVSAITGMGRMPSAPLPAPAEPWFSRAPAVPVGRHLLGNASALFTLVPSTNDGFALVRPEVLDLLPRLRACDPRNGRLWPARVILHELMSALTATGARFELVPDLAAPLSPRDPLTETASEGRALHHAAAWLAPPDAPLWAVTRLAQDAGTQRIRRDEGQAWRDAMTQQAGFAVPAMDLAAPWAEQAELLARMAGAAGQTDLAVELLANLHPAADHIGPDRLADFVRAEAAAIHLAARYRAGAFRPLNLLHDYSVSTPSKAELLLHANTGTQPRAAILFPDVDLSLLHAFAGRVSLPDDRALPVRLRIDVFADVGTGHLAIERVLQPGGSDLLSAALPPALRGPCRVVIGVEMADPLSPHDHAYVRLVQPRFLELSEGVAP